MQFLLKNLFFFNNNIFYMYISTVKELKELIETANLSNVKSDDIFVVAGHYPWDESCFLNFLKKLPGNWFFAKNQLELEHLLSSSGKPRYIFFIHWSQRVPDIWVQQYECVCFHMTDVPFGRGGTPLQNLIVRGFTETVVTSLQMNSDIDAGPVYFKRRLSLEGSAEEIYIRQSNIIVTMIIDIITTNPKPSPQIGEVVLFKRRKPHDSVIPDNLQELEDVHRFIRMLDADGYPKAYFEYAGFRFEFSRANLYNERIIADVKISLIPITV